MKKRSLFAAVAMLIVSAIVLTSATFAWFQSNGAVTMEKMAATSAGQSVGLMVSATNTEGSWVYDLKKSDYQNASGNVIADTFAPVDAVVDPSASNYVALTNGSLNNQDFTWENTASTAGFIKFTTYVKSVSSDGDIRVGPTLGKASASGSPNLADFVYFAAKVEPQTTGDAMAAKYYFANATTASKTYEAITGGNVTTNDIKYVDANVNSIIDAPSGGTDEFTITKDSVTKTLTHATMTSANASFSQANADNALHFNAVAGNVYKITIWVWAEGQDVDCNAQAAASSAEVQLNLRLNTAY